MRRVLILSLLCTAAACSSKDSAKTDTTSGMAPATPAAGTASAADTTKKPAGGMAGMAMTGDPDHDFLRMMSDHHKGLIAMAHETVESKDNITVKPIAKRLDAEQDKEIDKMSTMLDSAFKDSYTPMIMPDNQAMLDSLKSKTGAAYDHTFLENVIKHHEAAVKMIDDYLPKAKMPALKAMAEQMKATQQKEITEFQAKLKAK